MYTYDFGMCSRQNITEIQTNFKMDPVNLMISNRYAMFLDNLYDQSVFGSVRDIEYYICNFVKYVPVPVSYMPV